ncbi:MAG: MaoC/PaaZ C-terminal domain-containing protein [Flavobacteriales bacterium]
MSKFSFSDFEEGREYDLGKRVLTEQEIIDFAKLVDPLDFHTSVEAGRKSHFKGLVASGAHVFTKFHIEAWLPLFKDTVMAGLEVNHWKFIRPVYPGVEINGTATIKSIKPNREKAHAVVVWKYRFFDCDGNNLQLAESVLLHKMD